DFTVNAKDGAYVTQWEQVLHARVVEGVLRAVLGKVKDLNVEEATRSQKDVEDAVTAAPGENALSAEGITVTSCSIPKIEPAEEEVKGGIGAEERQAMLTDADRAVHERRLKASTNERAIKTYEAETVLRLEEERAKLLAKQGENERQKATDDAAATAIRLAPL